MLVSNLRKEVNEIFQNSGRMYCNYLGVSKKQFPKWGGWKIIGRYKSEGVHIKEINDSHLNRLVVNFHYLLAIKQISNCP